MKEQITVEEYQRLEQKHQKLRNFIINEYINIINKIEFLESIKKSKKRMEEISTLNSKAVWIEELLK